MTDAMHGQVGAFGQDALSAAAVVVQQAPAKDRYIGILDDGKRGGSDDADTWLLTLAICIPVSAAVGVVIAYSIGHDPFRAFAVGAIIAVLVLGLLLTLYRVGNFGSAQHASVDTYNELCRRMDHTLRVTPTHRSDDPARLAQERAFQGVAASGEAFRIAREKRGLHWLLSRGYIDLQGIVHRAEQDLMLYEPLEQLLDDALIDQARLTGSQIPQRDDLLRRSSRALAALCPESTAYLPPAPAAPSTSPAAKDDPQPAVDHLNPAIAARVILQDVRYQVNSFRNDRRRRLVQVRDNLISTLFLTGLVTVLLLALLVMGRPSEPTLLGGAILYAIGMIVGLFVHLSAAPDSGK